MRKMNISIIYTSQTGNTKDVAYILRDCFEEQGHQVYLVNVKHEGINERAIEQSDLLLVGSYTWGNGELPIDIRNILRYILKEKNISLPPSAVFGTGEMMWTYYCRAVDEIAYHLSKYTKVLGTLKIEQSPVGLQEEKVKKFANYLMEAGLLNGNSIEESKIVRTV